MHQHFRWNSSVLSAIAFALCCGGTGCVFEGGHVLRRAWFDYNTLATPAIFFEETHHLPLRSSRTEHLRWMYNQNPTLRYDRTGLEAYAEKQQTNSWVLNAHKHPLKNGETDANPGGLFSPPAPDVESQPSRDNQNWTPGFVPPTPAPIDESNKKNKLKKTKSPALKSPPETGKKKSARGPVALGPRR